MGKIVKYCAACEESFAEKFGFCPNCGQQMTAFEMNPVVQAAAAAAEEVPAETISAPVIEETSAEQPIFRSSAPTFDKSLFGKSNAAPVNQVPAVTTEPTAETIAEIPAEEETVPEAEELIVPKTFAAAASATNGGIPYQTENFNSSRSYNTPDDDAFHVTVIEEKNGGQRNKLLLGTMVLMLALVTGSTIYSLFNKDLGVGAIGDEGLFALVVVDNDPMEVEKPPEEKKVGDEGGGGGGGGRKDNEPISKGSTPPQLKERFLTPSKEDISMTNAELKMTRATLGKNDIIPKDRTERNGDKNSTNLNPSNGLGPDNLGMGQNGSGGLGNNGRDGQGANGDGGIGFAKGNNYGNKDGGPGGTPRPPTAPPPPPEKKAGVTQKFKILSKPRADYTDLARQNQVTGTVTVKVTFLSSGQVGSVVPVNGLPYGLTEKAIAAAKGIKFEPATRDGVPTTTVATVQYNFNIY